MNITQLEMRLKNLSFSKLQDKISVHHILNPTVAKITLTKSATCRQLENNNF